MNYPLISEYIEAIKAAEDNFDQLKHLRPVLGEDGEPVMTSGNFAVVFKMKDGQTGKLHAVKCFLKEQEGRAEAYRQIAEELEFVSSTFLTPIKYLDKELFVDSSNSEDSEFPVLLMDWVEGQTLDKYIREHIDDQYELSLLAYQFSRLAMWLMPQPFAHGDLKPDNILVKEDGTLVLVDYDGMYVPAMKGQKARELGSPDFRHPSRTEEVFDDHIDDFSLASILLSLKAIALQPSLLEEYGASDRLLFSERDYRNLSESSALGALQPLMQDAELASLYSLYILALSQNNLSQVSFRLFNLKRPDKSQYEDENLSTEMTDEDRTNTWIDEYGVMYSADRKRLLYAPDDLTYYIIKTGTEVICDSAFVNYDFEDVDYQYIVDSGQTPWDFIISTSKLKIVSIPQSVVKIGKDVFDFCDKLDIILIPIGTRTKFEKYLQKWKDILVETPYGLDIEGIVYLQIRQRAHKLFSCFDDKVKRDLNEDLLLNELTLLETALLLNVEGERINECKDLIKQKILDDYLSINDIDDYDSWIVNNTPGMYSNDIYLTDEAIPLAEFEKENGQVTFHKGKINAYPYDDSFWGEFVDKNGKKQIIYVNQGFPFEYNVSELSKNKSGFGIVKEKDTYYQSDDSVYCLKKIKKKHSLLLSYIKERISFYKKSIEEIQLNRNNYKAYIFQLYNAVTNEILNYNAPYLGVNDLVFDDEIVVNNETGYEYHYSATSLNNFTTCFWKELYSMRQDLNKKDDNLEQDKSVNTPDVNDRIWPLLEFARMHGKMKVGKFENKETGEIIRGCVFVKPNGTPIYVVFSSETSELSPREIVDQKNELYVLQQQSGSYILCKKQTQKKQCTLRNCDSDSDKKEKQNLGESINMQILNLYGETINKSIKTTHHLLLLHELLSDSLFIFKHYNDKSDLPSFMWNEKGLYLGYDNILPYTIPFLWIRGLAKRDVSKFDIVIDILNAEYKTFKIGHLDSDSIIKGIISNGFCGFQPSFDINLNLHQIQKLYVDSASVASFIRFFGDNVNMSDLLPSQTNRIVIPSTSQTLSNMINEIIRDFKMGNIISQINPSND